ISWIAPMSSRGQQAGGLAVRVLLIVAQPTKDLVTDPAPEGANGLGLGVSGSATVLQVVTAGPRPLQLGDSDAVDAGVELPIAAATEAVTRHVAGPHRDGRGAVVTGEGGAAAEA